MDHLDKQILSALQNDFPLSERPYEVIAAKVGADVDEVFRRVQLLVGEGAIRRLGASLDSRKLGYSSTLAAVRVQESQIDVASQVISDYPEVTHSYLRDNEFNIWFTLIATDTGAIAGILEAIRLKLGLGPDDVLNLPVQKLFKLDARFKAAD
ncbi:MAG: AsnC family transcriptional regulator [Phycisphaerae bacterium]|nr:AsnC family transcriptional regulator [Phycisphaerae bacterium]